jgi:negative regulator of sigma E activity
VIPLIIGAFYDSYLFELKQHWNMYHFYRQQLQDCDGEIDKLLQNRVQATGQAELVYEPKNKQPYLPQSSEEHQEKVRKLKIKQIQRTIDKLKLKESELFALST